MPRLLTERFRAFQKRAFKSSLHGFFFSFFHTHKHHTCKSLDCWKLLGGGSNFAQKREEEALLKRFSKVWWKVLTHWDKQIITALKQTAHHRSKVASSVILIRKGWYCSKSTAICISPWDVSQTNCCLGLEFVVWEGLWKSDTLSPWKQLSGKISARFGCLRQTSEIWKKRGALAEKAIQKHLTAYFSPYHNLYFSSVGRNIQFPSVLVFGPCLQGVQSLLGPWRTGTEANQAVFPDLLTQAQTCPVLMWDFKVKSILGQHI